MVLFHLKQCNANFSGRGNHEIRYSDHWWSVNNSDERYLSILQTSKSIKEIKHPRTWNSSIIGHPKITCQIEESIGTKWRTFKQGKVEIERSFKLIWLNLKTVNELALRTKWGKQWCSRWRSNSFTLFLTNYLFPDNTKLETKIVLVKLVINLFGISLYSNKTVSRFKSFNSGKHKKGVETYIHLQC